MNRVILLTDDIDDAGMTKLCDRRATHILKTLKLRVSDTCRIGLLDGPTGTGTVISLENDSLVLQCDLNESPSSRPLVSIILALPRPKVMKRLWAPLSSLGVDQIFVVNAEKVGKSYFATQWLESEKFRPLLIEGLEQAGHTCLPKVEFRRRLKPFLEDELDSIFPDAHLLLAQPAKVKSLCTPYSDQKLVLAIGPEGGWSPFEESMFQSLGFSIFSLGPTTLRTDTACVALIGALQALK